MRSLLPTLLAFVTVSAVAADDVKEPQDATLLDPITVVPRVTPLDEPYERLRRMMSDPYCDGCPPLIQVDREHIALKILAPIGWLTGYGLEVPDISHEDRLDFHLANDWRKSERPHEN